MNEVNIVCTYGEESYKVYWIKQAKSGDIYHGFHFKNKQDFHFSYHKDGKSHIRKNKELLFFPKRIPISGIKDICSLMNFNAGDKEWVQKYYVPYKDEKLKNIVWIDARLFPNDIQIQVELYLIKPEHISVLLSQQFRKTNKNDYRLIQIIQDINPWLIIQVRNLKYLA